ncbi:uncharacterized protein [Asterias amurensis]|uniref:uncharacterized protein n=1 Tax=Asterias amurensis TaxID=7602 RepID=UPI003AB63921
MFSSRLCSTSAGKKTRADNFSEEDKMLLLSLIADYVGILESRKTDHKSNSDKYKAWATISKRFHRMASHPRNFTQMKDLYRRLKLKAKKEVGIWLKACVDSGADIPAPGSNVIRPDDTSFLVYEMIKPFKEELNPDDKEHERLLAEARKNRETNEFTVSINLENEEIDVDEQNDEESGTEIVNSIDADIESIPIKEELEFDYVLPDVIESTPEESGETIATPVAVTPLRSRSEHVLPKRAVVPNNQPVSVSTSIFNRSDGQRQQKNSSSRPWHSAKRMRTFPAMERHDMPQRRRFSSAFASHRDSWGDFGNGGSFVREPPAERHSDVDVDVLEGMSPYESSMFQIAQTEHKAKMLVLQTKRRAETAKEEAYKMMWQNAQLQRDLLQLQYESII